MNKLLLASILILPTITFAAEETNSSQYAIDSHGICQEFSTEETLPETWKIVDSCENYASKETGSRPEDVLARRWAAMTKKLLSKKNEQDSEDEKLPVLNRSRVGSGTLTRGGSDREVSTGISRQPRRTTTTQQYSTTKQFLLDDSRRLEKSRDEWIRRRNARSGIKSGSATEMERTGKLSTNFWSTEQNSRSERLETKEMAEGTESFLGRQAFEKQRRIKKKPYVYKGISLRRLFRGTRLEGSIE